MKNIILRVFIVLILIFIFLPNIDAQQEVIVRPLKPKTETLSPAKPNVKNNFFTRVWHKIIGKNKELTPEEKIQLQYQLAIQRHLLLQDEKTRQRILHDIKMTNNYYDKQKESIFVKWIKYQKFKLKRKKII